MKKNITYLCMAAAALLVSSCTQNEEITPTMDNEGRVPVLFTAKNSAVLETRADSEGWGYGHKMGISMLSTDGSTIHTSNAQYKNETYEAETSLVPVFDNNMIYYPTDGSDVKFNAYIPYEAASNGTITWTFADRDGEDFYTATTEGDGQTYNESTGAEQAVSLTFRHRLSQIIIKVDSKDYDVKKALSGTLSNHPLSFTYNVATGEITQGEKGNLTTSFTTNKGEVRFTILPEGITQPETITIPVAEDVSFEATLPYPEGGFKAGVLYNYKTTLTATKTPGTFKATVEAWGSEEMGTLTSEQVPVEP